MHELRKDPIIGRWVVMAKDRARRPGNFIVADKSNDDISLEKECCFPNECEDVNLLQTPQARQMRPCKYCRHQPEGYNYRLMLQFS